MRVCLCERKTYKERERETGGDRMMLPAYRYHHAARLTLLCSYCLLCAKLYFLYSTFCFGFVFWLRVTFVSLLPTSFQRTATTRRSHTIWRSFLRRQPLLRSRPFSSQSSSSSHAACRLVGSHLHNNVEIPQFCKCTTRHPRRHA